MRVAAVFFLAASCLLLLHFGSVRSMSDMYGQNPQHEFGAVWGQVLSPLIPYWSLEGDAFANQDFVRLVPDRQSKRGGMWNTESNRFTNWEATFSFHIHGVSLIGADGLAFWYTKETSRLDGGFFGFTDQFTGLGIVIDTYDNDNTGLHPLLVAIVNDGTKKYTHSHETEQDGHLNMEVGNCQLPVRNLQGTSIVKVTYRGRTLRVETQLYGATAFTPCLVAENIDLPQKYHFGFTAATGQLADNHDIYGFSIKNLDPNAQQIDSQRVFSSYDKYQVSEFLSKIYFEVTRNDVPNAKGAKDSSVTKALDKLSNELKNINKGIASLEAKLDGKASVAGGPTPPGQNNALTAEIQALKQSVNALSQQLAGPPARGATSPGQQQQQQQQQQPHVPPVPHFAGNPGYVPPHNPNAGIPVASSGSSVWSYLLYFFLVIVVLALSYLGYAYYKVKTEKEKKYF